MRYSILYAILAGILWGVTYPLTEIVLRLGQCDYITLLFCIYTPLISWSVVKLLTLRSEIYKLLSVKLLLSVSLLVLISILSTYLFIEALRYVNAATLSFVIGTYPIITLIIESLYYRRLTVLTLIVITLFITGMYLLTTPSTFSLIGVLIGLAISILYAIYTIVYNYCCKFLSNCSAIVSLKIFLMSVVITLISLNKINYITSAFTNLWYIFIPYSIIILVSYLLETYSHVNLSPSIVALALSTEPITATILTHLMYMTLPNYLEIISYVLITTSIILSQYSYTDFALARKVLINSKSINKHVEGIENCINNIRKIHEKLCSLFLKLDEEITGLLVATISRENCLLIGPPGTGKTTLIYILSKLTNAKWFYRQLTKFTDLEEILGPIDIAKLLEGKVERIYTNSIVDADFALLDEIFNASSAILNTLLSILNERVVYDGDKIIEVRTWTVFGSSNRIPEEEELQALYDRFPIRTFLSYINPEETEQLITKGWLLRKELENCKPIASMNDIKKVHEYVINKVYEHLDSITKTISPIIANYVEYVQLSNRTRVKVPLYVLSYLIIKGFSFENIDSIVIKYSTLKILKYLVQNKDQLTEYYTFVKVHLPDDLVKIYEVINEVKGLMNNLMFEDAKYKIYEAEELLNIVKNKWGKLLSKLFENEINELESILVRLRKSVEEIGK